MLCQPMTPTPELKVYVSGSVASPGVYSVDARRQVCKTLWKRPEVHPKTRTLSASTWPLRVEDEGRYHVPTAEDGASPFWRSRPLRSLRTSLKSPAD